MNSFRDRLESKPRAWQFFLQGFLVDQTCPEDGSVLAPQCQNTKQVRHPKFRQLSGVCRTCCPFLLVENGAMHGYAQMFLPLKVS